MFVAKVLGNVVTTQKVETMTGAKLLVIDPLLMDAKKMAFTSTGKTYVAVDAMGAGEGEIVLVTQGSSARMTPETKSLPIDTLVVGIVDTVHVDQACVFGREPSKEIGE